MDNLVMATPERTVIERVEQKLESAQPERGYAAAHV